MGSKGRQKPTSWSFFLHPEHAGGPYTLTVAGTNTITLQDVLVGDVWFASGQSNMQLPLKGFGPDTPLKNSAGRSPPQLSHDPLAPYQERRLRL